MREDDRASGTLFEASLGPNGRFLFLGRESRRGFRWGLGPASEEVGPDVDDAWGCFGAFEDVDSLEAVSSSSMEGLFGKSFNLSNFFSHFFISRISPSCFSSFHLRKSASLSFSSEVSPSIRDFICWSTSTRLFCAFFSCKSISLQAASTFATA